MLLLNKYQQEILPNYKISGNRLQLLKLVLHTNNKCCMKIPLTVSSEMNLFLLCYIDFSK